MHMNLGHDMCTITTIPMCIITTSSTNVYEYGHIITASFTCVYDLCVYHNHDSYVYHNHIIHMAHDSHVNTAWRTYE